METPADQIQENVPLASLTTMRLGGNARYVITAENAEQVELAVNFAKNRNLPFFVLGDGANSIGRDEGYDGVIIKLTGKGKDIIDAYGDRVLVRAQAGEIWDDFVRWTVERGLSGIEALAKIPGTCGAAPVQNIGAYGQDIAAVISNVEVFDTYTGKTLALDKEALKMTYRSTIFNAGPEKGRYIILSMDLMLKRDTEIAEPLYNSLQKFLDERNISVRDPQTIYNAVAEIRADKLPDPAVTPSAGSFFKNVLVSKKQAENPALKNAPIYWTDAEHGKLNSGWLVEQAGLAGKTLHGFYVNEKAALVLENVSAKSYADLDAARAEIVDTVFSKFGIKLEQEPVEIVA